MGSSQSVLSAEGAVAFIAVAGAIGIGYTQLGPSNKSSTNVSTSASVPGTSEKQGKKKKKQASKSPSQDDTTSTLPPIPQVVSFPAVIPGGFDAAATSSVSEGAPSSKRLKGKKKKSKPTTTSTPPDPPLIDVYNSESSASKPKKSKSKRQEQPAPSPSSVRPLKQPSVSVDTDGSWTRVESGRGIRTASTSEGPSADVTTSDAGITTPVTGHSSPVTERTEDEGLVNSSRIAAGERRPLAERLLPKPRKTEVDDMLEMPDHPTLSRVMRVQPRPDEQPASGFSWGDYEDVQIGDNAGGGNDADGEDDGWGVVKSKKRSKIDRNPSSSQIITQKAPEMLTKRQRQNANKRDAQKGVKAEAEAERLSTLAKHKKALETARMMEQLGKSGSGKVPSGGMKATIDERGKLVWE